MGRHIFISESDHLNTHHSSSSPPPSLPSSLARPPCMRCTQRHNHVSKSNHVNTHHSPLSSLPRPSTLPRNSPGFSSSSRQDFIRLLAMPSPPHTSIKPPSSYPPSSSSSWRRRQRGRIHIIIIHKRPKHLNKHQELHQAKDRKALQHQEAITTPAAASSHARRAPLHQAGRPPEPRPLLNMPVCEGRGGGGREGGRMRKGAM